MSAFQRIEDLQLLRVILLGYQRVSSQNWPLFGHENAFMKQVAVTQKL
jgi:hypothetical protein